MSKQLSNALIKFEKEIRDDIMKSIFDEMEKMDMLTPELVEILEKFINVQTFKEASSKKRETSGYNKFISKYIKKIYSDTKTKENLQATREMWKNLKIQYPNLAKDGHALFAKWEENNIEDAV